MDFLKLNNEFLNLQKKLEDSERFVKSINNYLKKLEKEILKLEQRNEMETDIIQKAVNERILNIKSDFKKALNDIMESNKKV